MKLERAASILDGASAALLLVAAALSPTQASVTIGGMHLSPADPLLLLSAGPRFLAIAARREWRRLTALPWTAAAFLAWFALAACLAADKAGAAKEFIQCALYFGVALGLFRDILARRPRAARIAATAVLLVAGVVAVALAVRQYLDFAGATFAPHLLYFRDYADALPAGALEPDSWFGHLNVRGTFGNRNVLGGFLALLLPMAFAFVLEPPRAWMRWAALALLVAGACVNLSGGSMLGISAALLLQAAAKKRRAAFWAGATLAALVALAAIVLPRLPRENTWELARTLEPFDADSGLPARRYPEWQAATEMALDAPWFGVSPGAYQRNIGQYFGAVPRATGPAEPDIQNLYLVIAATAGIPAAALLSLLLAAAGGRALIASREGDGVRAPGLGRALALGSSGALAAFAIAAIWSPLLVRGLGIPLAMILAIATSETARRDDAGVAPAEGGMRCQGR